MTIKKTLKEPVSKKLNIKNDRIPYQTEDNDDIPFLSEDANTIEAYRRLDEIENDPNRFYSPPQNDTEPITINVPQDMCIPSRLYVYGIDRSQIRTISLNGLELYRSD